MEKTIKEYLRFLTKPELKYGQLGAESLIHLCILFFIVFFLEMMIAGIMYSMIGMEDMGHMMDDIIQNMNYGLLFLMAVIIAPALEEFIFRFYLKYPALSMLQLLSLIWGAFVYLLLELKHEELFWTVAAVGTVALSLMTYQLFAKWRSLGPEGLYNRIFPMIFYLSAVIFAFVHIYNFQGDIPWYYTPILVFPQFFLALFLGYVRIRNGIVYAILFHGLNNSIPMILLALAPNLEQ